MKGREARIHRVQQSLAAAGVVADIRRLADNTATAVLAAAALGCEVSHIGKSLMFVCQESPLLAIVGGDRRADTKKLTAIAGHPVCKANAAFVLKNTGFEIGGVPPIAHTARTKTVMDKNLLMLPVVWVAAGSAHAVFPIAPSTLAAISGAIIGDISQ